MKIFYGVQGTGNGHISRARALNRHFKSAGVQVDYFFSGRTRNAYFDMEEFGDWRNATGLSFVAKNGKIDTFASARNNSLWEFVSDIRSLDLSGYDRVICDFEPITAWAARRQKIDCISFGHQYAFQHHIPIEGQSWLSQKIIKYFAPGVQQLGLHWHHFDQPILPPIVHTDGLSFDSCNDHILVYLGFESPAVVTPLLQQFPGTRFIYYGEFSEPSQQQNVRLEPLSVDGFKRDLQECKGVICNAGFELTSEALQLGKRILVKPLHGQMEQCSNALALEQLDLGSRMNSLSKDSIEQWLQSEQQPSCSYPDVAKAIVDWLLEANPCTPEQLAQSLWKQTDLVNRRGQII